jgi:hypothetical protein
MPTKPLDRLMFAQGERCFFCKQPLPRGEASVEHLLASAKGGSNDIENCVACCKVMNALLGSMSLKDKFQVVLNQKGNFKCPTSASAIRVVSLARTPPRAKPEAQAPKEAFDMVVANLTQRGNSRPRTIKTLTSTVASLLPKGLPEAQAVALVQTLQATGKVSFSENKVSYYL